VTADAGIREALAGDEFELVFQPRTRLADCRLSRVEALVRWRHPVDGLLLPEAYLPAIERLGLMRELTLKVLELALAQAAEWGRLGMHTPVVVSLPLTCLHDDELVVDLVRALCRHGVDARLLTLEVAEAAVMADPHRSSERISELKRTGVGIALADFGVGQTSLTHLRHLELDELKVDASFVAGMAVDERDAAIVRMIVQMGREMRLRVAAEGVRDLRAWAMLDQFGCDEAQGFWLSRPVDADMLTSILRAQER